MILRRTRWLCLICLAVIVAGCKRHAEVALKREGSAAEITAQFTNLLATGNAPDRAGAIRALGTMVVESWDQDSTQTAMTALLRAMQLPDTNIQKEVWHTLLFDINVEWLPFLRSAAISNAAVNELGNVEPRVRCVAALTLLRQNHQNEKAATVLLSLLNHPDSAVRHRAKTALTIASDRNDLLKERLQAQVHALLNATNEAVRSDATGHYWEIISNQSEITAARMEAERLLVDLFHSTNRQVRRSAAQSLLAERNYPTRFASIPLQDFIDQALSDSDPFVAATIAHVVGKIRGSGPGRRSPDALEALKLGLQHPDPAVRLAALSPMSASTWWRLSKGTNPDTSYPPGLLEKDSADPIILEALTNALHDTDREVRQVAASTIWYLTGLRESLAPALWQMAIEELESQDASRRQSELERLWFKLRQLKSPERLGEFVKIAMRDPDWQVRLAASRIVELPPSTGISIDWRLWSRLRDDPFPTIRVRAGEILARQAAEQGRGTNAAWSSLPVEALRLVDDPFPEVSLEGLTVLRLIASGTNETRVVVEARNRLHQIAVGTNVTLKVRLARCYGRAHGLKRPSVIEKDLRLLAAAPEHIVRRHAVTAFRNLGLSLPDEIQTDPDPEIRIFASKRVEQGSSVSVPGNESLEVLLEKLKAEDPAVRRKAALGLRNNYGVNQKRGVAAEAITVLLDTYTNMPPAECDIVNGALHSLVMGPDYAALKEKVEAFAMQLAFTGEPGLKKCAWKLLAEFTRQTLAYEPKQIFELAEGGLPYTRDADVSVRIAVMQVLSRFESSLAKGFGDTNGILAKQIRTALVDGLRDSEPKAAISAATLLFERSADPPGRLDRLFLDAELSAQAAQIMEGRLADPHPDVRQIMAFDLALMGANQSNTNWVEKALSSWESLFTRTRRLRHFSYYPNTEVLQVDIIGGTSILSALAFRSSDSVIRQRAIQTLARLIDVLSENYSPAVPWSQVLVVHNQGNQVNANELEPLQQALLRAAGGTNIALADEANKCLSRIRPPSDTLPDALVKRAHSTDAVERRLAMLELLDPNHTSTSYFREAACGLATALSSDPVDSVRLAALKALASNLFGYNEWQLKKAFAIEPLIKALNDANPEIQQTAFGTLSANLYMLPPSNQEPLALPLIKRMMTAESPDRLYGTRNFADFAGYVTEKPARQQILLDVQERIDRAENDVDRSKWLSAIGKLYLGFNEPDKAANAFEKAIRLNPTFRDDLMWHDLEVALQRAGRSNEVALHPASRPDSEILDRLRALAQAQDVAGLLQTANRALDGYLPAYGGPRRGWGEPEQVMRETVRLLFALQKRDAAEEFLKGALKRYPESPQVPLDQATLQVARERKEEAKSLLERELQKHYWNNEALEQLGALCRETHQVERYETVLRGLVESHPDEQMLCRPMVELFVRTGRTNEARQAIAVFQFARENVSRNSGFRDFSQAPQYSWHQSIISELLELSGDFNGAMVAQIEANKTAASAQSLLSGQKRLEALYQRGGSTKGPRGATDSK